MNMSFFTDHLNPIIQSLNGHDEYATTLVGGKMELVIQVSTLRSVGNQFVFEDVISMAYRQVDNSYSERLDSQGQHLYWNRRFYEKSFDGMLAVMKDYRTVLQGPSGAKNEGGMSYREIMENLCTRWRRPFIHMYTEQVRIEHLIDRINAKRTGDHSGEDAKLYIPQAMELIGVYLAPGYYVTKEQATVIAQEYGVEVIEASDLLRMINVRQSMTVGEYCKKYDRTLDEVVLYLSKDPAFKDSMINSTTKVTPSFIESLLYEHFDDVVVNRK